MEQVIKIAVGSKNKVKVESVIKAVELLNLNAEIISINVESGVPAQPFCDETYIGAKNRATRALEKTTADIGIGIEGGVCEIHNKMLAYAVVFAKGRDGNENFAYSASFTLPEKVAKTVKEGLELGYAIDKIYNMQGTKFNEGAVGILTRVITRKDLYVQPVIMALYPFYNKEVL